MPSLAIGLALPMTRPTAAGGGGTPANIYLRPGGVDNYFRPDGASYYIRP